MLRRRVNELLEELKQSVAPTRPEIGTPVPRTIFERARPQSLPEEVIGDEITARPRLEQHRRGRAEVAPKSERGSLKRELASAEKRRSAFRLMEVLGPPVSLRDPLDRVQDR